MQFTQWKMNTFAAETGFAPLPEEEMKATIDS